MQSDTTATNEYIYLYTKNIIHNDNSNDIENNDDRNILRIENSLLQIFHFNLIDSS